MINKKNICFITGTRAEFGIGHLLLKKIEKDNQFNLNIVATGTHLSEFHGLTYKEIIKYGFKIHRKISILDESKRDGPEQIVNSMSLAMKKFGQYFKIFRPDILILIGDRYELLMAASAALIFNIPIAHIHGGEISEGAFDESIRHAITKMSHIHFTSHIDHSNRIINMGENPKNVYMVGGLGSENINKIKKIPFKILKKKLNIKFDKIHFIVTFHPVTLELNKNITYLKEILKVIALKKNLNFLITFPNADTEGLHLIKLVKLFCAKTNNSSCLASLGQQNYFSLLKHVDGVIGNSSSGLLEVPSFKITTIDVGSRQKGRVKAKSVINCKPNYKLILQSIKYSYTNEYKKILKNVKNPYSKKGTADQILKKLSLFKPVNTKKTFFDK